MAHPSHSSFHFSFQPPMKCYIHVENGLVREVLGPSCLSRMWSGKVKEFMSSSRGERLSVTLQSTAGWCLGFQGDPWNNFGFSFGHIPPPAVQVLRIPALFLCFAAPGVPVLPLGPVMHYIPWRFPTLPGEAGELIMFGRIFWKALYRFERDAPLNVDASRSVFDSSLPLLSDPPCAAAVSPLYQGQAWPGDKQRPRFCRTRSAIVILWGDTFPSLRFPSCCRRTSKSIWYPVTSSPGDRVHNSRQFNSLDSHPWAFATLSYKIAPSPCTWGHCTSLFFLQQPNLYWVN